MGAIVYLDIETDEASRIYLIGLLSRATGLRQLIGRDVARSHLLKTIPRNATIVTFNGSGFDVPAIRRELGVDLEDGFSHLDLMHSCRERGLTGGLKVIEKRLGFAREYEPLHYKHQWNLRRKWTRQRCVDSRDRLLRYNAEDLVGLRWVRNRLPRWGS